MFGENGILNQALKVSIETENSTVYENFQLKIIEYKLIETDENIEEDILRRLRLDGYVNSDNTVNLDNLIPNNELKRGKGSLAYGDVYVLEQREKTDLVDKELIDTLDITNSDETAQNSYYLIYYNSDKEEINLGRLFDILSND